MGYVNKINHWRFQPKKIDDDVYFKVELIEHCECGEISDREKFKIFRFIYPDGKITVLKEHEKEHPNVIHCDFKSFSGKFRVIRMIEINDEQYFLLTEA